jgi:hypothetical protein
MDPVHPPQLAASPTLIKLQEFLDRLIDFLKTLQNFLPIKSIAYTCRPTGPATAVDNLLNESSQ